MRNRFRAVLALVAASAVSPTIGTAQTNGFVLQCLSARTSARGCVTRAQSDVPTSLFRDPAGLVAFARPTLEVNVAPFIPQLTFENAANATTVDGVTHTYPMASFAYVGRKISRLSWAVGLEPIGGFGSDFDLQHTLLSGAGQQNIDYKSFFAAAKFGPAAALDLGRGFSVGAGASGVYAQIRDFRMPFAMSPTLAKGLGGIPQLDAQVYGPLFQQFTEMTAYGDSEGYAGLTWAFDAGIAYRSSNGFALSASWSPRRPIQVDGGSAVIDMNAQFGQMLQFMAMARAQAYQESPDAAQAAVLQQLSAAGLDLQKGVRAVYDAATTITLPLTLGAGATIPLNPRLQLAAEVEWRQWSRAQNIMPFNLSNGDNPNLNLMLNANPADGRFDYPFPLEWQDAFSAKLGASYLLRDGTVLRAGYITGENPVPDETVFITFPAISEHAATVGASWKIGGFPLDISFVHAFREEMVGCNHGHKMGSEYTQSRTTMSQNVFTLGTVITF